MKQETYDKLNNMLNEALAKETPESWNTYLDSCLPEIDEAADDYVGHPKEVYEGITVSSRREAFKDGAKYAFEKAADWFGNNAHRYMYIESNEYYRDFGYDTDKLINDFKNYVYNQQQ